jgi:phage baseplate assembly protein gpV
VRRRGSAVYPELSDLRELLVDGKVHAQLGVVVKPTSDPHWRKITGKGGRTDIVVEVETSPLGYDLTCRLTSEAGGHGMGLWRVPAVGAEVLVVLPDGELEFMPTIAKVYSSGSVPERAGPDRTVLVAPDALELQAPRVVVGPNAASSTQGVVVAENSVKLGGDAASEPIPLGNLRKTAEDAFLDAVALAFTEIATGLVAVGQAAPLTAALGATGIDLYKELLAATLSTVSKTR